MRLCQEQLLWSKCTFCLSPTWPHPFCAHHRYTKKNKKMEIYNWGMRVQTLPRLYFFLSLFLFTLPPPFTFLPCSLVSCLQQHLFLSWTCSYFLDYSLSLYFKKSLTNGQKEQLKNHGTCLHDKDSVNQKVSDNI